MTASSKTRRLGQHLLQDPAVADRIVRSAELRPQDVVLEIGPGTGVLTERLVPRAGKVVAVEVDPEYCAALREKFRNPDVLEIVQKDILKFDLSGMGRRFKVVSNLPYSISVPVFLKLLREVDRIDTMVLMFQKEVADRLTAEPGNKTVGSLTHAARYYFHLKPLFQVPKTAFKPVPQVGSSVLRITPWEKRPIEVEDEEFLFRVIRAGFSHRRKTLLNNLTYFFSNRTGIEKILGEESLDLKIRAEQLRLTDFARISEKIGKLPSGSL